MRLNNMDQAWWKNKSELDKDQLDIIGLPLGNSYLIAGPPGSGKTNLLLLRASYLTLAGHPNIQI